MQSARTGSTRIYDFLAWAQVHRKQVIAGVVALLVLIVIGYVVHWKNKQTRLAASEALLTLVNQASSGTPAAGDSGPRPADLLQVAEQYSATTAAQRALLLAAGAAYRDGDYSQAAKLFGQFEQEHSGSELAPIAALGVATSLDAQNQTNEAVSAYEQVIAGHSRNPVANRARLGLATLFEQMDKPADALRIYDGMTGEAGFSELAFEASARRERLLLDHPELAPTPAPASTNAVSIPQIGTPTPSEGTATVDAAEAEAAPVPASVPTNSAPAEAPAPPTAATNSAPADAPPPAE